MMVAFGKYFVNIIHYTHVRAMNSRASLGIMRPVLPEERIVSGEPSGGIV